LRNVSETAVLNANYIAAKLCERYAMPFFDPHNSKYCAHEFVTVPQQLLDKGVTLIDIAKRMIDYGVHPPTMHWPIHDCFMVEPTETESKFALDSYVEVLLQIADEIDSDIELVKQSPLESDIARADEVAAARKPIIAYPK
jgi:glycine dehydrogenase subunit 2